MSRVEADVNDQHLIIPAQAVELQRLVVPMGRLDPDLGKCPRIGQVGSNRLSNLSGKFGQENHRPPVRPHGNKPPGLVFFKLRQHDENSQPIAQKCKMHTLVAVLPIGKSLKRAHFEAASVLTV